MKCLDILWSRKGEAHILNVLYLKLGDLSDDDCIVMSRFRVYFFLGNSLLKNQNADSSSWKFFESDGDYRKTNSVIDSLTSGKIEGDFIADLVSDREVGLLQFAPSYIWAKVFFATQIAEILQKIFSQYPGHPPEIVVVNAVGGQYDRVWLRLVRSFAKNENMRCNINYGFNYWSPQKIVERWKCRLKGSGVGYVMRHLKRLKMSYLGARNRSAVVDGRKGATRPIMFVTLGDRHWGSCDGGYGADEQCYPIAKELLNKGYKHLLFIDAQNVSEQKLKERKGSIEGADLNWEGFSGYCNYEIGYFFRNWWRLKRQYYRAVRDKAFRGQLSYCGVSLVPSLRETLKEIFLDITFEAHEFLNAAAHLLAEEQPEAVVLTYETGPVQRAIIIEAARLGIPTIGLQHGMIFDNHYDYMHAVVTTNPLDNPRAITVPTKICVWGHYWAEVLVHAGSYPASMVCVTGNWRYDWYEQGQKSSDDNRIALFNGISSDLYPIAVLTAASDTEIYIRRCLQVISYYEDFVPVIKLHPIDRVDSAERLISEFGLPAETLYLGDLKSLLFQSKIIISQFSTVVSEAILLDRDVVLLNLNGMKFTSAYTDSGACLYAETVEELRACLWDIFFDAAVRRRLAAGRKDFVERNYYRIDGLSAKRVSNLVDRAVIHKNNVEGDFYL